jgi:peptidoglycan hydrolase CwlO-like protein
MLRHKKYLLYLPVLAVVFGLIVLSPAGSIQAEDNCKDIKCEEKELGSDQYQECVDRRRQCLQEEIKQLENKVDQTQEKAQTLQSAITVINGEIRLQQLQISQSINEINELEREINELAERIDGLSLSLDRLTDMLIARIQHSYKQKKTTPIIALFTSDSFRNFIGQYKYLHQAEVQTAKAMEQAENQRLLYDQQKDLKQVKQNALEEKRQQLQAQKATLEQKKNSKQKILTETKNDEATYQRLLYQAKKEISSLKSYAKSQVGSQTCLSSSPGQPDGWFYSQRDPRWCKQKIGNSNEIIGEVGCLISSTAMIWQKHGHETNPSVIGANPDYFSLNTAYMKSPIPAPPGYKYKRYNYYDPDIIDEELSADRPVIVHIAIGGDGHFVVLKEGADGDYIMNDPIFGPDMPFDEKYKTGMIDSIRTFTPE